MHARVRRVGNRARRAPWASPQSVGGGAGVHGRVSEPEEAEEYEEASRGEDPSGEDEASRDAEAGEDEASRDAEAGEDEAPKGANPSRGSAPTRSCIYTS